MNWHVVSIRCLMRFKIGFISTVGFEQTQANFSYNVSNYSIKEE